MTAEDRETTGSPRSPRPGPASGGRPAETGPASGAETTAPEGSGSRAGNPAEAEATEGPDGRLQAPREDATPHDETVVSEDLLSPDLEAESVQVTLEGDKHAEPRVLAAIPAYNEEVAIGSVVLRTREHVDEVLVVDDASTDATAEVAEEAGATVTVNEENRGKGFSVRRAFAYAEAMEYDALVLLDGDGQHDPAEIPDLVEPVVEDGTEAGDGSAAVGSDGDGRPPWAASHGSGNGGPAPRDASPDRTNGGPPGDDGAAAEGPSADGDAASDPYPETEADVSLGFRFGDNTEMPLYRRFGKRVLDYATAFAQGSPTDATDSQAGFRAFNRRAIRAMNEELSGDGFGIESEQLVVARDRGLETTQVPITCRYEGLDASTEGPFRHGLGVLNDVVEMATMRRPLLTMGVPSAVAMVAGGGLGIYVVQYWRWTGYFSLPQAMGAGLLVLLGLLGIMSALILNMMARVERRLLDHDEAAPEVHSS